MSDRSLYRDEFIDPVRLPTRGRARITSGANASGAGQTNLNYYFPCGDQMTWKAASDSSQPDAATLLSKIVPAVGASAPLKIQGYYSDGAGFFVYDNVYADGPHPSAYGSYFWDGTFPQWLSGYQINPRDGAYWWFMSNIPGSNNFGLLFQQYLHYNDGFYWFYDVISFYNTAGNYNPKYRAVSVRVINQKIYWLVAIVDSGDYILGCWYKICGTSPYGDYQLVTNNVPPGTAITDWLEYNGRVTGHGTIYSMNSELAAHQRSQLTIVAGP